MKKAQVAYEFMMIFFVLAAGFTTWLAFASSVQDDIYHTKNLEKIKDFSLSLKHEIFVVAQMHDGFSRTINMPKTIDGQNYEIRIEQFEGIDVRDFSTIYISSKDIGFYTHFDVPYMTGEGRIMPGEKITITKKQGELVLS
jgi:hypothetical protein